MTLLKNFVFIWVLFQLPTFSFAKNLEAKNLYDLSLSIDAHYIDSLPSSFKSVPVRKARLEKDNLSFYIQATYIHIRWDKPVNKLWINGHLIHKKTIANKSKLKKRLKKIFRAKEKQASFIEALFIPKAQAFFGLFGGFLNSLTSFVQRIFSGLQLFSKNSKPQLDNNNQELDNFEDEAETNTEGNEEDPETSSGEVTEPDKKLDKKEDTFANTGSCGGMNKVSCAIHKQVNRERTKRGRQSLKANRACTRAAQKHAEDMARKRYFSHKGRDGSQPWDRVRRATRALKTKGPISSGENIAWAAGYRPSQRVRTAVNGWINSPGHFRNMMDRQWTHSGVGTAKRGNETYEVQIFCNYGRRQRSTLSRVIRRFF